MDRIKQLESSIYKAHELMHQGKNDEAEEVLHQALSCGEELEQEIVTEDKLVQKHLEFDEKFRYLCQKYKFQAAYLSIHLVDVPGEMRKRLSGRSGGVGWICKNLDVLGNQLIQEIAKKANEDE